jgi:hypothetical protein
MRHALAALLLNVLLLRAPDVASSRGRNSCTPGAFIGSLVTKGSARETEASRLGAAAAKEVAAKLGPAMADMELKRKQDEPLDQYLPLSRPPSMR